MADVTVVVGMGEVGQPLHDILSRSYVTEAVDLEPRDFTSPCSVMHICYPYGISDFVGETVRYIGRYRPALTVINSTVAPGTTRKVLQAAEGCAVVHSPVRGKHSRMEPDLLKYKKFVAGDDPATVAAALRHFEGAGFRTATFPSLEISELAKLMETTYLGLLVGWAQEMERLAGLYGGTHADINAFLEEIDFLPSHIFPGFIGGHCVMPNIAILRAHLQSKYLDAIVESNEAKAERIGVLAGGSQ